MPQNAPARDKTTANEFPLSACLRGRERAYRVFSGARLFSFCVTFSMTAYGEALFITLTASRSSDVAYTRVRAYARARSHE